MKIEILIDDPETRAVWEAAKRAKAEVAAWPAWKRGDPTDVSGLAKSASTTSSHVAGETDSES